MDNINHPAAPGEAANLSPEATSTEPATITQRELNQLRQDLARLQVEAARLEQEAARYRSMVENSEDLFTLVAADGTIVFTNPACAKIFGMDVESTLGQDAFGFVHPDDLPQVRAGFAKVLSEGQVQTRSYRARRADGSWCWLESIGVNHLNDPHVGAIVLQSREVTDRQQAEAELKESRRMLATLLSNLPGLAYRCLNDEAWTIQFASRGCYELTGYTSDELINNRVISYATLIHPDDQAMVWQAVQAALQESRPFQLSYRIQTRQGVEKVVWEQGQGVRDEQGKLLAIEGFIQDITERAHAENRQQAIIQGLHDVVAVADQLLTISDTDTLVRRAVELARERLGVERCSLWLVRPNGDLQGTYGTDLYGQTTDERAELLPKGEWWAADIEQNWGRSTTWHVFENRPLMEWNGEHMEPTGKYGWAAVTPIWSALSYIGLFFNDTAISNAAFDETKQELIAIYCSLLGNIIERQRAEEASRQSELHLRTVVENVPLVLYAADANGIFTLSEGKGLMALGIQPGQVVGQSIYDLFGPLEFKEFTGSTSTLGSVLQRVLAGETVTGLTAVRGIIYDNRFMPVRSEKGEITGLVGIAHDITALKRAEEQLQNYAAQLERSNRELQEFAYVASHDLQEPLRKIQTFSSRITERYSDQLDDTGRDYLERVQNSANRMNLLIQDLLSLSRVSTTTRAFKPVDLNRIVQGVLSDLEVRIEQLGASVEVGPLPTIDADASQMNQLFLNLLSNALKFQRPAVPPVVRVQSSPLADSGLCRLTVQDNGIGFDPSYADKIFMPFQRLHGRNEYEGTGMGLAICRRIVERHNGSITSESEPGKGTTFIVILPLRQFNG